MNFLKSLDLKHFDHTVARILANDYVFLIDIKGFDVIADFFFF